jgi:hypothetical protein
MTFFRQAGMAFPDVCNAPLAACHEVVQRRQRMVQTRPGAQHAALAAVVKQLACHLLPTGCVEVCDRQQHIAAMPLSQCGAEPS